MMTNAEQRVIVLNFHRAVLFLATPQGIEGAKFAPGDSDESEKLLNVLTMAAAIFGGHRAYVDADHPRGLPTLLWHNGLVRACRFADELLKAMREDAEAGPQVTHLTSQTRPKGLTQRIFVVLLISLEQMRAEIAKLETANPRLAPLHAAQTTAYNMIDSGAFAPREMP